MAIRNTHIHGDQLSLTTTGVVVTEDLMAIYDASIAEYRQTSLADYATAIAGIGLAASTGILSVNLDELSQAGINHANDRVAYIDNADGVSKSSTMSDMANFMAGAGLAAVSGALAVNADNSTLEVAADILQIRDLGITNAKIADDTIREAKLNATNAPVNGYFLTYDAATTGFTWVAGGGGGVNFRKEDQSANCNGTTTTFTLAYDYIVPSVHVYLNGLLQQEGTGRDYTYNAGVSPDQITFAIAPAVGDILIIQGASS